MSYKSRLEQIIIKGWICLYIPDKFVLRKCVFQKDWIGLDLFNDDTRPSGHISRPTQVNVSELLSFSKQLLKSNNIVQSGG